MEMAKPSQSQSQPQSAEPSSTMKLALAVALIRSRLQRSPRIPFSDSDALRWRRKAKDRKREILRLQQELKTVEDGRLCDAATEFASCKCRFFDGLGKHWENEEGHQVNEVLHRRFLRQVRWKQRKEGGDCRDLQTHKLEVFGDDELQQLSTCVDFLVEHFSYSSQAAMVPYFSSLSHQAVDIIHASLKNILSRDTDKELLESVVSSMISRLIRRMCAPLETKGPDSSCSDTQLYAQHLIRTLGGNFYVGQLALILISHKITELGESLLLMDPFNDAFPAIHDCLFVMIQLVEFLIMDHVRSWTKTEGFQERLVEDWLRLFLQVQRIFRLLEDRNGLYLIYVDRIKGELVKQLGGNCQRLFPKDVLESWFN